MEKPRFIKNLKQRVHNSSGPSIEASYLTIGALTSAIGVVSALKVESAVVANEAIPRMPAYSLGSAMLLTLFCAVGYSKRPSVQEQVAQSTHEPTPQDTSLVLQNQTIV